MLSTDLLKAEKAGVHGCVPHEYSRSKVYLGHLRLVSCAIASERRAASDLYGQTRLTRTVPPSAAVYIETLSKRDGNRHLVRAGFCPLVTKELLNVRAFERLL